MKSIILLFLGTLFCSNLLNAQCPVLRGAMANACGTSEGNNEFVVFTTDPATSAAVSTYRVGYGTTNPPTSSGLSGSDATTKTGSGSVSASGCTIIEVTSSSTIIPGGSKVIFISSALDQNYDVTAVCGSGTIYVAYIRINSNGGTNSPWTAGGTIANNPGTGAGNNRYLQVTYSGDVSCNGTNAQVNAYNSGWTSNTDGNFVTWNGTTPTYTNSGCSIIVLPINLLSFSATTNNNNIYLKWLTANESNIINYTVEKSENGINFTPIGTVAAKNNTDNSYQYVDASATKATLYYRLKIEENNGKISYSSIARVDNIEATSKLFIYPTVANTSINAKIKADKNIVASIHIIDGVGKVVTQKNWNISTGTNIIPIDINNLPKGVYRLRIIGENINEISSFIKN